MMNNTKIKVLICVSVLTLFTAVADAEKKFYSDDPIWQWPDSQDASSVAPWDIGLLYDLAENLFTKPGDKTPNLRAQNLNTVDEVPDSSWYTNRLGREPITVDEIKKGPNTKTGPGPGPWKIIAGKNDGVTPGFTIRDANEDMWFIKFDPPGYEGMGSGTEVAVTKLMWALGYHVAENYVATLKEEDLQIAEGTRIKVPSGKRRLMKESDISSMLRRASRRKDGTYRIIASLALPGKPLGGFRFYGTRPDDPNDVIPHEHRRELRAGAVIAAWLNHVDSKAINSLDILAEEDGKKIVRHYFIDFSSTLGSGSIYPHDYWEGYEHIYEGGRQIGLDAISFGFRVEPYRTDPFYEGSAVGRFKADHSNWDPDDWKPRAPNPAFLRARPDDRFWAARKIMMLSDDLIKAAISTGEFHDEDAEIALAKYLGERRDAIGRKYLTAINPVVDPIFDSPQTLSFHNAAVENGFASEPSGYKAVFYRFNNQTHESERIGEGTATQAKFDVPSGVTADEGSYIKVEISAEHSQFPSWQSPVYAYFRASGGNWQLVGFERML